MANPKKAIPAEPTVTAPTPTPSARPTVDPRQEYVSNGYLTWLPAFLRALPSYVDDITHDFGDDLYERMLFDPAVSAAIHTLKTQILAPGVKLPPARSEGDAEYDKACEIAAFCDRCLANMTTPLYDTLYNMLDALAFGNKVAEKVLDWGSGEDAGRLVLKALKPKQRRTTAFVVDAYNNVIGVLGLIPGVAYTLNVQTLFADPASVPNLLPREKFAVLTCRETDGDPRGKSFLRPAYNAWFLKTTVWPEYLKYLSQFGSPSVIGILPPDANQQTLAMTASGTPLLDGSGNPVYLSPQAAFNAALVQWRNGGVMVAPHGSDVKLTQSTGEGGAFLSATELFNREIEKAITGQTLATSDAQHNARAASQTHQDVLGTVGGYGRSLIETMLYRDVLQELVSVNYGPDAVPLTPYPVLSDTEQQDLTTLWSGVAELEKSGYLDNSQKLELDAKVGLPRRDPDSLNEPDDALPPEQEKERDEKSGSQPNEKSGPQPNEKSGPQPNEKSGPQPNEKSGSQPKAAKFAGDGTWITVNGHHINLDDSGDKSGGSLSEKTPSASAKSMLAKQSAVYVGADIQRYSEEHNEPILASGIHGLALRDNEPVDVLVTRKGRIAHGVELKTMVSNSNNKITMKTSAMARKASWMKENNAPYHTVVFDDHQVFNANGQGKHDDSKRQIYYKRGFGSFRVGSMHPVSDMAELNTLLDTPDHALPAAARPPKSYAAPAG